VEAGTRMKINTGADVISAR